MPWCGSARQSEMTTPAVFSRSASRSMDKMAISAPTPCKIGLSGQAGWIAYRRGGTVLVKRATYHEGATYPDFGASLQCYSGGDFIEIETLGPLVSLAPGASVDHRETWTLHAVDETMGSDDVMALLGLGGT